MSGKTIATLILAIVASGVMLFSGCTTAPMRRQSQRIEELERRVSKMEFELNGEMDSSSDAELMEYRQMTNGL